MITLTVAGAETKSGLVVCTLVVVALLDGDGGHGGRGALGGLSGAFENDTGVGVVWVVFEGLKGLLLELVLGLLLEKGLALWCSRGLEDAIYLKGGECIEIVGRKEAI